MAINFPSNPQLNQTYTEGNRSWQWNGRFWQATSVTVGYTGSKGDQGDSIKLLGAVATVNDLPADSSGLPGDAYVVSETGDLYVWDGFNWNNAGRILGYTGSRGATGTSVRIVGSVNTSSELPIPHPGEIGDGYVVQDSGELWIWDGSSWGSIGRITGDVGPTGFTGSQGEGIIDAEIVGEDLIVTYQDSTQENLGRVLGYTGSRGLTGSSAVIKGSVATEEDLPGNGRSFVYQSPGFYYEIDGISGQNPTITVVRGRTYTFNFESVTSTHPIALRIAAGNIVPVPGTTGNDPENGVFGPGAIVTYAVPLDAQSSIVYQCVNHPTMVGTIQIIDETVVNAIGDGYIVQSTGDLWFWNGEAWNNVGKIIGDLGPTGFTGSKGDAGQGILDVDIVNDDLVVTYSDSTIENLGRVVGFTGSEGLGLDPWIKITSDYTAESGNRLIADTTNGTFTLTLPPNPTLGSYVVITDGGDWGVNQLIISASGASIEGILNNIGLDIGGITLELLWDGDLWHITATLGTEGAPGVGVPAGGTTGQVLAKASNADYDTAWVNQSGGVGGDIGSFEFNGSTMTTSDSSEIVIDQNVRIDQNLTMGGDVIPSKDSYFDLGSPTNKWRSLYVSSDTIFINDVELTVNAQGQLLVGGSLPASSLSSITAIDDIVISSPTVGQVLGFTGSVWTNQNVSASQIARFINLTITGDITPPRTGTFRFYPPQSVLITKIYASISAQAQGGAFTFQLNKNGVDTGAVLSIPEGFFTMAPVTVSISVNSSDYLTVDVTGVGSRDLHIKLEYEPVS